MAVLTTATVLALAASCQSIVAPVTIAQIAQHESGLDPAAVHRNADGSVDRGLMQINDRNDGWLGLTDPFDPCQSIHAASRLLTSFSRYNTGSPTKGIASGYAQDVQAVRLRLRGVAAADKIPPASTTNTPPEDIDDRPAWNDDETTSRGQ